MNYTQLKTAIQEYTQNTETSFVSNIDTFIGQAEERIFYDVDIPDFHKNVLGTATAGSVYLSKPTDFYRAYSMAVVDSGNVYTFLIPKDVSFIREAFPDSDTTGTPRFYAHFDDDFFLIAPATSSNFSTELHYKAKPAQLSSSNANTWLSDNAESALLYGALVEAYTYLKGEQDIMAFYEKRYKEALGSLTQYGAIETNVDSYRNGMRQTA